MVVLVETSRARCRSEHHPGRPFTPVAAPRVGPTAACLGAARTPPAPSTAPPLAGVELLGRVVDKEKGRTQGDPGLHAPDRRLAPPACSGGEAPGGLIEVPAVYFERVGLFPRRQVAQCRG